MKAYGIPYLVLVGLGVATASAQFYEDAPFYYTDSDANDPASKLVRQIESGAVKIDTSDDQAFLRDLLAKLDVPIASQVLVYSKTSFQNGRIAPSRPRALYFSEDCYIGWVQGGDIEIISIDPELGPIFYFLEIPRPPEKKMVLFRSHECLNCHGGSRTAGVPGMLVRSVYADTRGFPLLGAGTYQTDHSSPIEERWGGWYVTGEHDGPRHMGNRLNAEAQQGSARMVRDYGTLKSLDSVINTDPYLSNESDIVALMVLEHQITVHNLITQSHYNVRRWMHHDAKVRTHQEGKPVDLRPTTRRMVEAQAEKLLAAMLFENEHQLEGWGVEGGDAFQEALLANAPRSQDGRSLKDLELLSRLFRHQLSYMIYSQAFDHLPEPFKAVFYEKLHAILIGKESSDRYAYLKESERHRILKILTETKPEFAERL